MSSNDYATQRSALNLLVSAPEFQTLERKLRNKSVFQILGIENRELSHAKFLAWLLNPLESHGMGNTPLRGFLLLAASKQTDQDVLDVLDVDELELDALRVETEIPINVGRDRRLDVLVSQPPTGEDERGAPILIVEYKVDAKESKDQTRDYAIWAANSLVPLRRGPSKPLQVFLSPTDSAQPEPPFVLIEYETYCEWLRSLASLECSSRAKFLVEEFLSCLAQRRDVENQEVEELCERLNDRLGAAIAVLRFAPKEFKVQHAPFIGRHAKALFELGLVLGRVGKGESAFVLATRETLRSKLTDSRWEHLGGAGSLRSLFLPATHMLRDTLGLNLQLFMARPLDGRASMALEVTIARSGTKSEGIIPRRIAVAESLRKFLLTPPPLAKPATNSTVLRFNLKTSIQSPEDDHQAAVDQAAAGLSELALALKELEPQLERWAEDELPGLIAKLSS